jgi:transglutaminase-like putative cysteine protease
MRFRVSSELFYKVEGPTTLLFALKCIETEGQKILREFLHVDPEVSVDVFRVGAGMNRFTRIQTSFMGQLQVRYEADIETSVRLDNGHELPSHGLEDLSPEAISYLFPSRYCQSDRLRNQAFDLFGHLVDPYTLASEICDWIYVHVAYRPGSSNEKSSAVDTLEERVGVCRDFAHLAIAFCRSMNLPARYVTCYSHLLYPPDFHAVIEVFIGGTWYVFDPTRLAPLNGLVRIATGRDAADAAVCTIFGGSLLNSMQVICNSLDETFTPITWDTLRQNNQAIALL